MYTGILLNKSFDESRTVIDSLHILRTKIYTDSDWIVYQAVIDNNNIEEVLKNTSKNMIDGPWYNHFYNEDEVVVVFKDKIFRISKSNYDLSEIIIYSQNLDIPSDQIDIKPINDSQLEDYFNNG